MSRKIFALFACLMMVFAVVKAEPPAETPAQLNVESLAQLYAKEYLFEAEHTYVNSIVGGNFSSNPTGRNCVIKDTRDMGASNGYYVGSLCNQDAMLEFEIYVTEDVEDAILVAAVSSNTVDYILNSDPASDQYYIIGVNGVPIEYGTIEVVSYGPFVEVIVGGITLKKDVDYNSIAFYTANTYAPTSGIFAAAPAVDYIKIYTNSDAEVTQELYEGNY